MALPSRGARITLLAAAAGLLALRLDPDGNGKDPVLKGAVTLIALAGILWTAGSVLANPSPPSPPSPPLRRRRP
ncbi:MAG: hypothetical protein IAE87_04450 [Rhodobacteraceae bacterium]|nr:hypothetical protein [Paracoccaceae bacterium]